MMTPLELLTAGREVIANRDHWTRGAIARDKSRDRVHPTNPKAVCFCSIGALRKVTDRIDLANEAEGYLKTVMGTHVTIFNDRLARNHAEVLAAWDKAIELARNDEAQAV